MNPVVAVLLAVALVLAGIGFTWILAEIWEGWRHR